MLALDSEDAAGDAALFARSGLGSFEPLLFGHKAARPDGTETHAAFTLAFAVDSLASGTGLYLSCHDRLRN